MTDYDALLSRIRGEKALWNPEHPWSKHLNETLDAAWDAIDQLTREQRRPVTTEADRALVERLRQRAQIENGWHSGKRAGALMAEAADAIDRLTKGHEQDHAYQRQLRAALDRVLAPETEQAVAAALIEEQTTGLCRLGMRCADCDCFGDSERYARDHARLAMSAVRAAAEIPEEEGRRLVRRGLHPDLDVWEQT